MPKGTGAERTHLREQIDQQDEEQKCQNTATDIHFTPPIVVFD